LGIDIEDYRIIARVLRKFYSYRKEIPLAFAAGYLYLQQGKEALDCFRFIKEPLPYDVLLTKADALELYGNTEEANAIRWRVYQETGKLISEGEFKPSTVEAYLRSAIFFEDGNSFEEKFVRLKKYLSDRLSKDIYLAYLFYKGRESEVYFKWKRDRWRLAPWMKLSLALYWEDRYLMERLLSRYLWALPIRDRVVALEEVGQYGRAFKVAYEGLKHNPQDEELLKIYRDLTVDKLSHYYGELSDRGVKGFNLLSFDQELRYYLVNNYYLDLSDTFRYNPSKGTVFQEKKALNKVSLGVRRLFDYNSYLAGGVTLISGGGYEKKGAYVAAGRQFWHQSYLQLSLYRGELSDESEFASLGAFKEGARLEFTFPFYNRLSLFSSFSVNRYRGIDGTNLGTGSKFYGELSFVEKTQYPDYKLRAFFSWSNYAETDHRNTYVDKLGGLTTEQVLPKSFYSLGLGLNWGYDHRDTFVKSWRPYFDGSISYTNRYGFDSSFTLGVGGRFIRKDNLHFEVGAYNSFKALNTWGWYVSSGYRRWF
jgi:hypothetical protein